MFIINKSNRKYSILHTLFNLIVQANIYNLKKKKKWYQPAFCGLLNLTISLHSSVSCPLYKATCYKYKMYFLHIAIFYNKDSYKWVHRPLCTNSAWTNVLDCQPFEVLNKMKVQQRRPKRETITLSSPFPSIYLLTSL